MFVAVLFCERVVELKPRAEETQRPNLKTKGTKKHAGGIKKNQEHMAPKVVGVFSHSETFPAQNK